MDQGMVYKGIVVEILKNKYEVVALMRDGNIQTIKADQIYEIGDEIVFKEKGEVEKARKAINWSKIFNFSSKVALASLLFFVVSYFNINHINNTEIGRVYASTIYVESKSNIKVDLDSNQEVINVIPLNKPAKRVLVDMAWQGKQIDNFINIYFEKMKDEGYLGADDKAIISVVPNHGSNNDVLKKIKQIINQNTFLKSNDIQVFTVSIPEKVVKKAEENGVTVGKFVIILISNETGEKPATLNISKIMTVTELIDANPIVAKILPNYSEEELEGLASDQQNDTKTESNPDESQPTQEPMQSNPTSIDENKTDATPQTSSEDQSTTDSNTGSKDKQTKSTEQTSPTPDNSANKDSSTPSTEEPNTESQPQPTEEPSSELSPTKEESTEPQSSENEDEETSSEESSIEPQPTEDNQDEDNQDEDNQDEDEESSELNNQLNQLPQKRLNNYRSHQYATKIPSQKIEEIKKKIHKIRKNKMKNFRSRNNK